MKNKEYKFKQGFTIKTRSAPSGVFYAMGDFNIVESKVFDLYLSSSFFQTYKTFEGAKNAGEREISIKQDKP